MMYLIKHNGERDITMRKVGSINVQMTSGQCLMEAEPLYIEEGTFDSNRDFISWGA